MSHHRAPPMLNKQKPPEGYSSFHWQYCTITINSSVTRHGGYLTCRNMYVVTRHEGQLTKAFCVTHVRIRQFSLIFGRNLQNFRCSCISQPSGFTFDWYCGLNPFSRDEILTLSRAIWPGDELKISSGVSRSRVGDELIVIVQ